LVTARIDSYDNQFLSAEQSLINFAEKIKEHDTRMSAARPQGFCLGPVVVTGEFKYEVGSFLFRDGKGNDFGIEINTDKGGGPPLLARMSAPDSLLTKFHVRHRVLRARERNVAGMRAQEWLGWANLGEHELRKSFGFT
jgi:hypothetical protein